MPMMRYLVTVLASPDFVSKITILNSCELLFISVVSIFYDTLYLSDDHIFFIELFCVCSTILLIDFDKVPSQEVKAPSDLLLLNITNFNLKVTSCPMFIRHILLLIFNLVSNQDQLLRLTVMIIHPNIIIHRLVVEVALMAIFYRTSSNNNLKFYNDTIIIDSVKFLKLRIMA